MEEWSHEKDQVMALKERVEEAKRIALQEIKVSSTQIQGSADGMTSDEPRPSGGQTVWPRCEYDFDEFDLGRRIEKKEQKKVRIGRQRIGGEK